MHTIARTGVALVAGVTLAGFGLGAPAVAGGDRDGDGIPSSWERAHGLDPLRAKDARWDLDKDGLTNLREYRNSGKLRDEDSDDDGIDDGDEVKVFGTDLRDADENDNGRLDGDDDRDRDGVDNEDEDDADERCRYDDEDSDDDDVSDEDENELRLVVGEADSDGDGLADGDEDRNRDGVANEDEDDDDLDECDGDYDDDGESDEDDADVLGTISAWDPQTMVMTIATTSGFSVTVTLRSDTEVEIEDWEASEEYSEESNEQSDESGESEGSEDEGTLADLRVGLQVAELDMDDDSGTVEEIEVYRPVA